MKAPRRSKACGDCRRRRIQCNETRPRCAQCLRAGLPCGGYRTDLDLIFVDDTETTLRRIRRQQPRTDAGGLQTGASAVAPPSNRAVIPKAELQFEDMRLRFRDFTPPGQVSATLASAARVFYLDHYAVEGPASSGSSQRVSDPFNIRYESVVAVGIAGLARIKRDPLMMALARSRIGTCLHHMAQIVRGNCGLDKQLTLATINKMAMFEMVTCDSEPGSETWTTHTRGAVVLLQHWGPRGLRGVKNVTGILYIIFSEAIACLIQKRPIPLGILTLISDSPVCEPHSRLVPAKELFAIIYDLAELNSFSLSLQIEGVAKQVSKFRNIEERLSAWEASLPGDWLYHMTEDSRHHTYSSLWPAGVWNMHRICRILLHTLLIRSLRGIAAPVSLADPTLVASCQEQLQQSQDSIMTTLDEFRAGIPYQLGTLPEAYFKKVNTTGAFNLLNSIQMLGNFKDTLDRQMEWLPDTLDCIGETLGIGQAMVLKSRWSNTPT